MQDVLERDGSIKSDYRPGESHEGEGYGLASKALMGAAAGAIGTFAIDRTDWAMWKHESEEARLKTNAVRPGGEPPAHVMVGRVEKKLGLNPTPEQHEIAGVAAHYSIGIAPAIVYAMVRDKLPGKGVARGLLYGFGLFLVQDEGLNTLSGLGASPRKYPWQAHARGLIAHLAYGVATELALNYMDRSVRARRPGADTDGEPQGKPRAIRD